MIDYEGFPYLSFIDENIQKELNNRSSLDNRVRNINSWIKVTSGVQKVVKYTYSDDPNLNLDLFKPISPLTGKNTVAEPVSDNSLYSIQSIITTQTSSLNYKFDDIYNAADNRPEPGIISADIKRVTKYGGVTVAQIKWQVNSLDQFHKYAPYFLNPGRTMLIEWGWTNLSSSIYALNRTEYEDLKSHKAMEAWEYLNNRSLKSNGLYDGMLGVVTNYDFSLRDDGGFDIMTEVTSQGAIMYGLNLVHQSNVSAQGDNKDEYQTTIKDFVKDELNSVVSNWPKVSQTLLNLLPNKKISPDVSVYTDTKPGKKFVTWGFIEDIIVNPWIGIRFGKNSDDTNGIPMFKLYSVDTSNIYGNATSAGFRSVKISNHPDLRSTNLNICFINNSNSPDAIKFSAPADNQSDDTETLTGYLRNIYVNLDIVRNAFLGADTLTDALLDILGKINGACIQYWDFNLKISEKDQTLRVIDANYVDKFLKTLIDNNQVSDSDNIIKNIYLFRLYGGNSIIKSINFSSKLSNDITMTALYSNNKEQNNNYIINNDSDAFRSIWNNKSAYTDYFYESLYYKTKNRNQSLNPSNQNEVISVLALKDNSDNIDYDNAKQFLPVTEDKVDQINKMKERVYGKSQTEDQKSNLIVPVDFEMRIEGIGGLRVGDLFWVDAVPDTYIENSVFQVTGIDHTIQNNYWTTTIKAILKVTSTGIAATKVRSDPTRKGINSPQIKQTIQAINTDGRDTSVVTPEDKAETLRLLKQIWQDKSIEGFAVSDKILNDAAIIIQGESSFRSHNFNTIPPDYSLGLFQINMIKPSLYAERVNWSDLGIVKDKASIHPTTGKSLVNYNLWDKITNIKAAKRIFKQSHYSWNPWSTKILLSPDRVKPPRSEIT